MSDNCITSELAPAKCINQAGSFHCSCDDHNGYRLSTDGTTCEGIQNECACIYVCVCRQTDRQTDRLTTNIP